MAQKKESGFVPQKPPAKPISSGERGHVPPKPPVKPPEKPTTNKK